MIAQAKPKPEPKPKGKAKSKSGASAGKGVKRDLIAANIGHEGSGCIVHDADGETRARAWLDDVQSAVFFSLARADATAQVAHIKITFL